jgi:hypothetical protein
MYTSAHDYMHIYWKGATQILVRGRGYSRMKNSVGPKMHSLELFYSIYAWVQDCEMPHLWYASMVKCEARIWCGCEHGAKDCECVCVWYCSIYVWMPRLWNARLWYISIAKCEVRIWRGCDGVNVCALHLCCNWCLLEAVAGVVLKF